MISRRDFVKTSVSGGLTTLIVSRLARGNSSTGVLNSPGKSGELSEKVWEELPKILARIVPPSFPARDFDITHFGAVGDGAKDCTAAFQK
ncbi:MAG: hypothetical protein ACREDR_38130, partial [Blastocatellia bacterium]